MQRGNESWDGLQQAKSTEAGEQSQMQQSAGVPPVEQHGVTSFQHFMVAANTALPSQPSSQQTSFLAGISGVRLPASQSLHALSVGQTPTSSSAQHASSACSSPQGQKGLAALIQVSGGASTPVLTPGQTTVMQRLFIPVSGQQVGGSKPLGTLTGLSPSGPSATSPRAVSNTMQQIAKITHSGGGSILGAPLHGQLSTSGGMVVVPPGRTSQQGSAVAGGSGSVFLSTVTQEKRGNELQMKHANSGQMSPRQQAQPAAPVASVVTQQLVMRQGQGPSARPAVTSASASGRTIHHHGQSPTKGGIIPPLAINPAQHTSNPTTTMNVNQQMKQLAPQQQQQLQAAAQAVLSQGNQQSTVGSTLQVQVPSQSPQQTVRRPSGNVSPGSAGSTQRPFERTSPILSQLSTLLPQRTSPKHSPERPRKKIKLEERPPPNEDTARLRQLICDEKLSEMTCVKDHYMEHLTELYFLQCGLNLMDYHTWRKKPPPQLVQVYKSGQLDSDDEEIGQEKKINDEVKVITTSGGTTPLATPVAISTQLPAAVAAMQQQQQQQSEKKLGGRHGMVFGHVQQTSQQTSPGASPLLTTVKTEPNVSPSAISTPPVQSLSAAVGSSNVGVVQAVTSQPTPVVTTTATSQLPKMVTSSANQPKSLVTSTTTSTPSVLATAAVKVKQPLSPGRTARPQSISAVYEATVGSQEAIVERAKQEAQVMQRVAELRKDGMWSARRLPKVSEPPRQKAHWDYLLEEMQWLAADFAQERKWKKAGARKIARMIARYHADIHQRELKAEKEEGQRLKRIASQMGKMVREFWSNIEKVVQYKQQSRLEEKRKKALDLHLSFIVDQTEKYSSWLTEGLSAQSVASSTSRPSSIADDGEFRPDIDESDDEETIAIEEEEGIDEASQRAEIDALQKESEIPIEELLKNLPAEILEKPASLDERENGESGDEADDEAEDKGTKDDDEDFEASEDSDDEEETIAKQEKREKGSYKAELDELQAEGEMSMEELVAKYAGAYDSDFEAEMSEQSTEIDSEESEEEEEDSDEEEEDGEKNMDEDVGLESLVQEQQTQTEEGGASSKHDLTDIAAAAQSLQPTGFTLETTQVRTSIPFILKHTLREYQHVGLDWMATMYDRKLNGILADEMGLGKTIQTIAVLAHLAIEHHVWGPHLIVVPTSVMLNWEMEFKKWAPAFKILTYYGNQKERKLKRTGWTKTNAFHICITSYKLVIQDHQAFRRKKWKYFILDEAQNIKNFKSQRWQTLLNFQSQRRLLLTGTPLQNSLMELWSLMHFLMPHVFASHREFKEWFSNPMTGMIEGSREYNEDLIRRLHKVLRPFLLRRLKVDVEKQMPHKYEHVVMCRLSKRQRYLYDDFMGQTKTKETLATGHFMSVINILMQLRKVCNHPNLFDPRPIVSPFQMEGVTYTTASVVMRALERDPLDSVDLEEMFPCMTDLELKLPAYAAHRVRKLQTSQPLIQEIDSQPESPGRPKPMPHNKPFIYRSHSPMPPLSGRSSPFITVNQQSPSPAAKSRSATPTATGSSAAASSNASVTTSSGQQPAQPITLQIHHTQQGPRFMIPSGQLSQLAGGMIQIVQTPSGQHILAPVSSAASSVVNGPTTTSSGTTILSNGTSSTVTKATSTTLQLPESSAVTAGKPVMRVSPVAQVQQSSDKPSDPEGNDTSHVMSTRKSSRGQLLHKLKEKERSQLYSEDLVLKRAKRRRELLERISKSNKRKCAMRPLYGADLCQAVDIFSDKNVTKDEDQARWKGMGHVTCQSVHRVRNRNHPNVYWRSTEHLNNMIRTPDGYLNELGDIISRFVFVVPVVTAPRIKIHASHPPPSMVQQERYLEHNLKKQLSPKSWGLHPISSRMTVQFPELRLIQYDCGKLQTLDTLLRRLKTGDHRVLIFTQMTKMLDVLESFLNYHGHRYLRLDGTTRVEQRQILMDRFNQDKRIFCFILSTRSGGIGVNLTGADTVIFYDSDWNPTMDAQAQDRCHRIGQTRDVHIYRLISEMTIEENILKKANQKRLMSDVAIEGGNFTTAFFKQQTLKELFDEPSGLKELAEEEEQKEKQQQQQRESRRRHERKKDKGKEEKCEEEKPADSSMSQEQIEQALCAAEDETDVQAAKIVAAEQKAEMAEFDENIPWDEKESEAKKERDEEMSKVEQELAMIQKELTPVERYAVQFMEMQIAPLATEELQKAEEEVTIAKEEWELSRLQALKEEEERRAELEEDEMLYTYTRDDASNQMYMNDETGEQMPMWCPPTPPHDENDVYIDQTMCFLFEPSVMPESDLPPIYVKKEYKRIRVDPVLAGRHHRHKGIRKDDQPKVPRSLFDRGSFAALRRDNKPLKIKPGYARPFHKPPQPIMNRPVMDASSDNPEWLIHEDWALLQCIQSLQELPLQLMTNSPAHIANWDLVADVVNASSRTYRSGKQCKMRYETVIVPREEGRILYDMNPRKQKKTKGIYKVYATKNNRAMKTSQLFTQDNNGSISTLHTFRFDSCKGIAAKRTPTLRPTLVNPTLKNPKHTAVLAESGINYEQPLNPIQVAQIRADRIAKEKKQNQQAAAAAAEQQQQQQQQQAQQQQQQAQQQQQQQLAAQRAQAAVAAQVAAQVATTNVVVTTTSTPQMAIVQGQQLTPVTAATTTVLTGAIQKAQVGSTMTAVSLARSLGASSIVVNTPGGVATNPLATFKRIPGQTVVGAVTQSTATVAALTQAVRTAPRTTTTQALTVQEISAAVAANPARVTTTNASTATTQVINTATLTQAQLVAAQRTASATTDSTVQQQLAQQTTTRTLTPAQLGYLKAQALIKQQQQQQLRQQRHLTPEQKQQQIRRIQAAQAGQTIVATQAVTAATVTPVIAATSVQKTVTGATPLITSVTPATVTQAARIQTAKPAAMKQAAVARPINDADVQAFLKRQQVAQVALQQKVPTQIIAGTQLQQVRAASVQGSAAGQPVATLVKAVSTTQASANLPSMTIPVSLHNVNISVSMPGQQKVGTAAGKQLTQLQRLQMQQMQKRATGTQQFATQQKVATLGQVQQVTKTQLAGTPLNAVQIIQQQQQKLPQAVTVQQFQQIVKQQQHAAQQGTGPTIQQIITSVGPATSTTATVIATQLVTQASTVGGQSVTRMSVPTTTATTASVQASRAGSISTTLTAVPSSAIAVVTSQQGAGVVGTQASSTSLPTVTLTQQQAQQAQQAQHQTVTLTQAQQPAVVKHVQEVIMSPQRATTIPIQSSTGVVGQIKSIPPGGQVRQVTADTALQQAAQVRQVAVSGNTAGVAGVTIHQVPAIATPTGTSQQVKTSQSIALQQAVQQVQAHAQAQQQTQQRQHVLQAVSGANLPAGTVTATLSTPGAPVVAAPVTPGTAVASTLQPGTQQSIPGTQTSPAAGDQTKPQYSLRVRNQPSKQ